MSLTYLEEDLPEIEIRELISGDQFVGDIEVDTDKKKGVNIYRSEDIYNQVFLLLQAVAGDLSIPLKRKTQAFQQIHQKVVQEDLFLVPGTILPEVALQRKDNGDEDVFWEGYEEAHKIGKYDVRVDELRKVFLGYETTQEEPPVLQISRPTEVLIKDTNQEHIVVLPKDMLHGTVSKVWMQKGLSAKDPRFYQVSLVDKVQEKTPLSPLQEVAVDASLSFEENVFRTLHAQVPTLIEQVPSLGSLYDIWKEFLQVGVDVDTLSKKEIRLLVEKLQALQEKDTEVMEFLTKVGSYRNEPWNLPEDIGVYGFYMAQKSIFDKLQPILQTLQEELIAMYQLFVDSIPFVAAESSKLPYTAYDIATMIQEQKITLEEVVQVIKMRVLQDQKQSIEAWLRMVQQWNVEKIEQKVETEVSRASQLLVSSIDEPYEVWKSVHSDIHHIKKGEVISKQYEEDMEPTLDHPFEPMQEFLMETENPEEITLPVYEDQLPVEIQHLDEGRRELYTIVLRLFMELQRASGLPLDYQRLTMSLPQQLRKTKRVQLQELFPDLSKETLDVLDTLDMDTAEEVLETIIAPGMYGSVRQGLHKVYTRFLKDLETQWVYLLGWWLCELQHQVLQRTLHFEIWKGSLACIQVWSPYGVPMEGLKQKKEGILPYLLCVIYELSFTKGTLWNKYAKNVNSDEIVAMLETLFTSEWKTNVEDLQARFKTFEKELPAKNLVQKGEEIKKQITDTVEQRNKQRYLSDYMVFLKNLPSVLVQSSIAKKLHIGCCLQMLSEKYRSDYDWAGYVKNAYKIKKLFATQRTGYEKRPLLLQRVEDKKDIEVTSEVVSTKKYLEKPTYEDWSVQEWTSQIEPYVPVADYQQLSQGVQKLTTITEKYLGVYMKMVKESTNIKDYILSSSTQGLVEFFRKILQVQFLHIQSGYTEKPVEKAFLLKEYEFRMPLYALLRKDSPILTELQEINKRRVLQYFVARQLCFPAKPEFARNNTLVLLEDQLEATLLTGYLSQVGDTLRAWVDTKQFSQSVDYADYIAKVREQENISKLRVIDTMNPEERRLYVDAKKLGIQELEEYLQQFRDRQAEEDQKREVIDMYEEEGEDEKYPQRGENDDEEDMDSLHDEE